MIHKQVGDNSTKQREMKNFIYNYKGMLIKYR